MTEVEEKKIIIKETSQYTLYLQKKDKDSIYAMDTIIYHPNNSEESIIIGSYFSGSSGLIQYWFTYDDNYVLIKSRRKMPLDEVKIEVLFDIAEKQFIRGTQEELKQIAYAPSGKKPLQKSLSITSQN